MSVKNRLLCLILGVCLVGCEAPDESGATDGEEGVVVAAAQVDEATPDLGTSAHGDIELADDGDTDEAAGLESVAAADASDEDSDTDPAADSAANDEDESADTEDKVAEQASEPAEPARLTIGSEAPQLDIEHWIQDGDGQFAKVSEFEPGKVYVVEFWATWCGPCISSMPHIAALQEEYADRGVQVVSITREDPETVEAFLDREVRGADEETDPKPTYRDLTSVYCLTADPDNSTSNDYMRAAKQNGIPCAFLVGKDGKIEWIGHPMSMDEPLEKVVNDQWNRDQFAEKFAAEQAVDELRSKISARMRSGDAEEAVSLIDEAMSDPAMQSQQSMLRLLKFQILVSQNDKHEQAREVAMQMLEDESMDAMAVNSITWRLYQYSRAGRFNDEQVLQAALDLANETVDDAGSQEPYLRDTIAHLEYALGNLEQALAAQQAAVASADDSLKPRLEPFLKQLQKELDEANAPDEPEAGESEEEATESESGEADSEQSEAVNADSDQADDTVSEVESTESAKAANEGT